MDESTAPFGSRRESFDLGLALMPSGSLSYSAVPKMKIGSARQDQDLRESPPPDSSIFGTPPSKMRLQFSILTLFLLHSARFVSARWETGLDGDLYGEIPRPTSEPLLYRDEFRHGAILMETQLGHERNGTTRRDTGLGSRQVGDPPGHRNSTDVAISFLATLVIFSRVPFQNLSPAALRRIQYVAVFRNWDRC